MFCVSLIFIKESIEAHSIFLLPSSIEIILLIINLNMNAIYVWLDQCNKVFWVMYRVKVISPISDVIIY